MKTLGTALAVTLGMSTPAAMAQQPKTEPLWQPFAAVFDADAPLLLQGRIVRTDWLEPRSVIWIEGKIVSSGEDRLWRVDTSASSLFSEEERTSFAPGASLIVRGYNAKDSSCAVTCRLAARDFTFADGDKVLPRSGTGACSLDQLLNNACALASRPEPPPVLR